MRPSTCVPLPESTWVVGCFEILFSCTRGMAAGVTDRLLEVPDLAALLEADERGEKERPRLRIMEREDP